MPTVPGGDVSDETTADKPNEPYNYRRAPWLEEAWTTAEEVSGDVSDETTAGSRYAKGRQQAREMGFLDLNRREAMQQLVHKELLIRELKERLAQVEAAVREQVAREIETRAHGAARIIRHPGQRPLCDQPDHDDRWCGTCASMEDGMEFAARMARGGAE